MKKKVALRLSEVPRAQKVDLAESILAALTTNSATFPNPNPSLTGAKNAFYNKLQAVTARESDLEVARANADAAEATLDNALTQLADYVDNVANGDPAGIALAGMPVSESPAPIGPLPAPQNLRGATADVEGTVNLRWNAVKGARSYVVECATNPNGPWTQVEITPRVSCSATGLTSGTRYWFRVRAVGSAGMSAWSDSAQKLAA